MPDGVKAQAASGHGSVVVRINLPVVARAAFHIDTSNLLNTALSVVVLLAVSISCISGVGLAELEGNANCIGNERTGALWVKNTASDAAQIAVEKRVARSYYPGDSTASPNSSSQKKMLVFLVSMAVRSVVLFVKHTVIGAPVVVQNRRLIFDEITVVALAIGPDLIKVGRLVTNGQGGELIHYVRIYRELVLVERINAPCWKFTGGRRAVAGDASLTLVVHASN